MLHTASVSDNTLFFFLTTNLNVRLAGAVSVAGIYNFGSIIAERCQRSSSEGRSGLIRACAQVDELIGHGCVNGVCLYRSSSTIRRATDRSLEWRRGIACMSGVEG